MCAFHGVKVKLRNWRGRETNRDKKKKTVIVICELRTCQGCCCSSHCSRSHSPSSESDAAGAPLLSEVEEEGDPSPARFPQTFPNPRCPSCPPPATLAVWMEQVLLKERSPGTPKGKREQVGCCSPGKSLAVGWRCCRCSRPLSSASRWACSGLQRN